MSEGTTPPAKPLAQMTLGDLLAVVGKGGGLAGWAAIAMIVAQMRGCQLPGQMSPDPPPILKKLAQVDVPNAIGQITMGRVGCTATIIGPIENSDRDIAILTAAHCIKVGDVGTMTLKDGRKFSFKCVTRNADADCAWLTAPRPEGVVPFALLATSLPEKGSPVWHQGYGVDRPGNVEKGVFQGVDGAGLKCQFDLSVSSGDSGGGIVLTSDGHVLSPVCCTTRVGGPGRVFGATPMNSGAIRPTRVVSASDETLYHPIRILPDATWEEPPGG